MHKKIMILLIALILLTGCVKIDDNDKIHANYVVGCLGKRVFTNNVSLGYKYYLPKGVKKVNDYDYNQKFLVDDTFLYMFVDINSYYYKSDLKVDKDNTDYYFQKINYDGKYGYVKIIKEQEVYYTRVLYNYAKIEFYSDRSEINKLLSISTAILNSIKYNKIVIGKVLDESLGTSKEFSYSIDKPIDASSNFSQYLEEYVTEDKSKEKLPDE